MSEQLFTEGVKPGGLTNSLEIRILLCYILDTAKAPVKRELLEEILVGEELANYFAMADGIGQLLEQNLVTEGADGFSITPAGETVARTLADEVPRTVRDTAVRGVIRAQQFAANSAVHKSEIEKLANGRLVKCSIDDDAGPLFSLGLYMPDDLSAEAVKTSFIEQGDVVFKLVLAALTQNRQLAEKALGELGRKED